MVSGFLSLHHFYFQMTGAYFIICPKHIGFTMCLVDASLYYEIEVKHKYTLVQAHPIATCKSRAQPLKRALTSTISFSGLVGGS